MNGEIISLPISAQPKNGNQTIQILQVIRQLIYHARMLVKTRSHPDATLSCGDIGVLAEAMVDMAEKLEKSLGGV